MVQILAILEEPLTQLKLKISLQDLYPAGSWAALGCRQIPDQNGLDFFHQLYLVINMEVALPVSKLIFLG